MFDKMNQQLCVVISCRCLDAAGTAFGLWLRCRWGHLCEKNAIWNGSCLKCFTVRVSVFSGVQVVLVFWMLHNEPA